MEHVISRADLARIESSPSASPEPDVLDRFKDLGGQFEFVASEAGKVHDLDNNDGDEDDEEGLDFQLFAAPKADGKGKDAVSTETHKIRLRSPSIDPEQVGFVRPHRTRNYYFADVLSEEQKYQLKSAALSGAEVLSRATSPWPGSRYGWKVVHLPPSGLAKDLLRQLPRLTGDEVESPRKRTRPGKKYRIKLRRKAVAVQARKDAKKVAEDAEREKRTRRNREKKVKRKVKEKAKKVAGVERDGSEQG